jgi:hypothetical protein
MLATPVADGVDRPGWIYEEKYDGDPSRRPRRLARHALTRNPIDRTERFAAIAAAQLRPAPPRARRRGWSRRLLSRASRRPGPGDAVFVVSIAHARGAICAAALAERRHARARGPRRPCPQLARRPSRRAAGADPRAAPGPKGSSPDPASRRPGHCAPAWKKIKLRHEEEFVIGGFNGPPVARPLAPARRRLRGIAAAYAGRVDGLHRCDPTISGAASIPSPHLTVRRPPGAARCDLARSTPGRAGGLTE